MTLLFVFGPPAVGKMTVGRAVADRSTYRLFHNHHTIEPLLDVFDFGTPPFNRLLGEFRQRVLEEAALADTDLVFTLVWALDLPEDTVASATTSSLSSTRDDGSRSSSCTPGWTPASSATARRTGSRRRSRSATWRGPRRTCSTSRPSR